MKKLIYSAWILSFASTGCLTLATAWKSGNFNDKTKIPATSIGPSNPWNAIDLRNFVVPNHHLNIQNQQAIDPSQADLNINLGDGDEQQQLIDKLLVGLDNKYANFNQEYFKENTYFEDTLNQADYTHTFDIVNTDTQQSWDTDDALGIQLGSFHSYNLALENLKTQTSFNFSLNLTYFHTNPQSINFTSFGALPYIHHEYYYKNGNTPHYDETNTLNANMNKYVNVKNPDYAIQTDSFFLNPISYSYHSSIWEDDDAAGYHPFPKSNPRGQWNWNVFQSFNSGSFSIIKEDLIDAEYEASGQYVDCQGGSVCDGQYMSVAMYTNYWRINNTNTFMFQGVGATESTMDYYPHGAGDWEIIPFYGYNSLTTSYNTDLFNNYPYPLDEGGFDAGQIIWNQLTNFGVINQTWNKPDITDEFVQNFLRNKLNTNNKNVLTEMQKDDLTFALNSGSHYFVDGINNATVTFKWFGETFTQAIQIQYNGQVEESAQDIASKLQGKTIVLDPKFWVGKDIKKYKEQLDNAIVSQGILTKDEVQYVSWGDLILNQARSYPNCDFTVNKGGETAVAHNITLDVENEQDEQKFNQINNLIEKDVIKGSSGQWEYQGPDFEDWDTPNVHIDTNISKEMNDLINSVDVDFPDLKPYTQYISFDKQIIKENQIITMHVKVGNYTKDYQVKVWWKSMDNK